MTSWINAKIWKGTERESSGSGVRLFVDGASVEDILTALEKNPEVTALYFGHGIEPFVLRYFFNKIRILVEVDKIDDLPVEFIGKVDMILRISNCVTGVKFFNQDRLSVVMLDRSKETDWDCQKIYETDKIIV